MTLHQKANPGLGPGGQMPGVLMVNQALTTSWLQEAIQDVDGGCLAGSVFTQQTKYASLPDLKVQVFINHLFAIVMG